jgi:hypothetical protein
MEILIFILAWIVLGGIGGWMSGWAQDAGVEPIPVFSSLGPVGFLAGLILLMVKVGEKWEESRHK